MARIGVLALQGGFWPHLQVLTAIGHQAVEVRSAEEIRSVDGLVLPGGESTAQLRLIERFDLEAPLRAFFASGKPLLATCAGLILCAAQVRAPQQRSLGFVDVAVARNAWGRQLDSFEALPDGAGDLSRVPLVFIRAPRIIEVGPPVTVLLSYRGEPVLVQQDHVTAASFHPELTGDRRVHERVFGQPGSASPSSR